MTTLKVKISTPKWRECKTFYQTVFRMLVAEEWNTPKETGIIRTLISCISPAITDLAIIIFRLGVQAPGETD